MASKNPLGKIREAAVEALKDPRGAAGKAVGQARGAAALGRTVAGHVTRSAMTRAAKSVGDVTGKPDSRSAGPATPPAARRAEDRPAGPVAVPAEAPVKVQGDPVAVTRKSPARKAPAGKTPPKKTGTTKAPSRKADTSIDAAAEDVEVDVTPADIAKSVARKAPAKKSTRKSTPSGKLPVRRDGDRPRKDSAGTDRG